VLCKASRSFCHLYAVAILPLCCRSLIAFRPILPPNRHQRRAESLISDSDSTPLRQIQLRSCPIPNVFLISYSDSVLFKLSETNVVTSKSQFTLASFLVSILKFDTILQIQQINKKRTPTQLCIRQNTPYFDSGFCPSLVGNRHSASKMGGVSDF